MYEKCSLNNKNEEILGFKCCFIFTPKLGEDSHFDEHMFQMGWFNHHQEIPCFCSTSKTNRLTLPSEFPMIFQ